MVKPKSSRHIFLGVIASVALFLVYMGILTIFNSFPHAVEQLIQFLPWILALVIGFGIQIGLYSYVKSALMEKQRKLSGKQAMASAGMSTSSMILCCLHHITDVLPIIGLSAATLFLIQYQTWFMLLGIFSNIIGILMMLEILQKNKLDACLFNVFMRFNMNSAKKIAFVLSIAVLLFYAIILFIVPVDSSLYASNGTQNNASAGIIQLSTKTNSENNLTVDITPINFSLGKELAFDVKFTTHSGSLDYDFAKQAFLYDDKGNEYKALSWNGPVGGHHISGTLAFPKINSGAKSLKLVLKNIYDVPERAFLWNLP